MLRRRTRCSCIACPFGQLVGLVFTSEGYAAQHTVVSILARTYHCSCCLGITLLQACRYGSRIITISYGQLSCLLIELHLVRALLEELACDHHIFWKRHGLALGLSERGCGCQCADDGQQDYAIEDLSHESTPYSVWLTVWMGYSYRPFNEINTATRQFMARNFKNSDK